MIHWSYPLMKSFRWSLTTNKPLKMIKFLPWFKTILFFSHAFVGNEIMPSFGIFFSIIYTYFRNLFKTSDFDFLYIYLLLIKKNSFYENELFFLFKRPLLNNYQLKRSLSINWNCHNEIKTSCVSILKPNKSNIIE